MKKILLLIFSIIIPSICHGQVDVEIIDGINNSNLKNRIENNASKFLSEIYDAFKNDRALNISGLVNNDAEMSIEMLWENVHFRTEDQYVGEILLNTNSGYQLRNIPLILRPQDSDPTDEYKEAVINFDRNGNISSLYFSIDNITYSQIMEKGIQLNDMARRLEILDYVERFRTSYNQKDLKFLNQVFSDDALIITGKVITPKKNKTDFATFLSAPSVKYTSQSKKEYLNNLQRIFKFNKYLNVNFEDVSIIQHPQNKNFYGVKVIQHWKTSSYSDEGYVFMVWDFTDPDTPVIHVRTWQPKWLDKGKTMPLPESDIFKLGDFDL